MGIPDHLTCLLRNLYAGQEATVRSGHGTTDGFQVGEEVHQVAKVSELSVQKFLQMTLSIYSTRYFPKIFRQSQG